MIHILLVVDVEGWAWWHMAQGIKKYAPCEVDIVTQAGFWRFSNTQEGRQDLLKYDSVLQFSWVEASHPTPINGMKFNRRYTLLASHGAEYPYPPRDDTVVARIATQIRNREHAMEVLPLFDGVLCVSERLRRVAVKRGLRARLTLPGVDTEIFTPQQRERGRLRIGWCGQSIGTTKGYQEVLVPLMGRVDAEFAINERTASDALTQAEMVEWYRSLDVLISTSCSEGFQMPPLEAMACGVPVIATDVGGICHLIEEDTGWVVRAWETPSDAVQVVNDMERLITTISRSEITQKGDNSRKRVGQHFSWKVRVGDWVRALVS